jgi:CheY-like chemotaxis protein
MMSRTSVSRAESALDVQLSRDCPSDGPEALVLYVEHRDEIDLVLTDLMMPLMDGVTLIRTLQRIHPAVKVIAATGRGDGKRDREVAARRVSVCLTKRTRCRICWKRWVRFSISPSQCRKTPAPTSDFERGHSFVAL